jgi:hypothetical protein
MPMIQPAAARVTLTPPDGEPLALYAAGPPAAGVVVLAHDYPDLAVAAGWRVAARGFAGTVAGVDGRTLTVEVDP